MSAESGHGEHHSSDDNLLALIAKKERELETQLSAARSEATSLDAQARAEAQRILDEARASAAAAARENEQRVAAEVARINDELLARAAKEVESLRKQATARKAPAVQMVVDCVVKGTTA